MQSQPRTFNKNKNFSNLRVLDNLIKDDSIVNIELKNLVVNMKKQVCETLLILSFPS
jgi:hypothetical protein